MFCNARSIDRLLELYEEVQRSFKHWHTLSYFNRIDHELFFREKAAKQWIQSVLRDESGAAIGADEEASYYRTYFRQPGDSDAVVAQKRLARDAAETAMQQKVGGTRNGATSGPRMGEQRMINVQLGQWDGHGWLPVGGR